MNSRWGRAATVAFAGGGAPRCILGLAGRRDAIPLRGRGPAFLHAPIEIALASVVKGRWGAAALPARGYWLSVELRVIRSPWPQSSPRSDCPAIGPHCAIDTCATHGAGGPCVERPFIKQHHADEKEEAQDHQDGRYESQRRHGLGRRIQRHALPRQNSAEAGAFVQQVFCLGLH